MEKKYWQNIEETKPGYVAQPEEKNTSMMEVLANEANDKSSSRRDFLKWCGISFFSATVVSACENPVKKAIPYLHQPETLTPGVASWYASTYSEGNKYCSILVKSRDGRPIKIEGNPLSSFTKGGTSAVVQASVLSLYDDGARYKYPMKNGSEISWEAADNEIIQQINDINLQGGKIVLLTPTLFSPATKALIKEAQVRYPRLEVITWDAITYEAIRQSHQSAFNQAIIPDYHFDKAELIVSFSADFLGTWVAPVTFANRYAKTRQLSEDKKEMSHHIQFEAGMSLTGSNADRRIPVKPSKEVEIIMELYNEMASLAGYPVFSSPTSGFDTKPLAQQILDKKGKALIVCGHNSPEVQVLINAINLMAESYGNTLDTNQPLNIGQGSTPAMDKLLTEMDQGQVNALLFYKTNPLYSHPAGEKMKSAMEKVSLSISFACQKDETASACNYILPDNHYLESWNDAEPKTGTFSLAQPVMQPIFNTRQFQATLLAWHEKETDFHLYLKNYWQRNMYPVQNQYPDFNQFWVHTLQAGVFEIPVTSPSQINLSSQAVSAAGAQLKSDIAKAGGMEFSVYENVSMADGTTANNPWLQELPDPVTKVTWDNFAAISPAFAEENNLVQGDIIEVNGLEIPVLVQPGQAYETISVALGYGRTIAGKSGDNVGVNVYKLLQRQGSHYALNGNISAWRKTGTGYKFAQTQTHHSMEGRHIVRESTLDNYLANPKAGNEIRDYHLKHMTTLYPGYDFPGHHWALMVDLNACTGCSTCVIACQAENNTPVIGKKEVGRRRIMHWMRIDRYYTGEAENPGVVYQPLMCQHCDNAPCENVCPVAATNHSQEGINQMAYNRCVGTKYCINNCPYKVRRFNWFQYAKNDKFDFNMNSDLGRMVLNPDVTVRERGVVEKCSFCIQRIQEAKLKAKTDRRKMKDGDVIPACAESCPSNALVFGDLNDKNSRVSQLIKDPRNYHLLEELHTLPSVGYLTKIRNKV